MNSNTKFTLILILASWTCTKAQSIFPYKNKLVPTEQRVSDLLSRMTATEKFWQLFMIAGDLSNKKEDYHNGIFGLQASTSSTDNLQMLSYAPGKSVQQRVQEFNKIQRYFVDSTRLGIPIIFFDEALHGLVRKEATAFPQSIGLAATFDLPLMKAVSTAIATECKQSGIRQILSPVVNLATDVRWGRTEETYGEDPYLVSEMSVAYVKSFEEAGIITTPKHFVVNHGDGGKDSYPIHLSKRALDESYFVPFRACIEKGGSRSIMTAYNSLEGSPCTANNWLLNEVLKKEWGFGGYVISDASATGGANVLHYTASDYADAGKKSIENGLDVIFQTNYEHYKLFIAPFLDGTLAPAAIDKAVKRVLKAKFELGLFDQPYIAESKLEGLQQKHQDIAKKAALAAVVLLKNENQVLPLNKDKKIALVGVDAVEARLGGYSGPGENKVNILEAIQQFISPASLVGYEAGCGRSITDYAVVPASALFHEINGKQISGLIGNYYNGIEASGTPALTRVDAAIDFNWSLYSPDPTIAADFYSAKWEGMIQLPDVFEGELGLVGNDGYKLFVDDKLLIDTWTETSFRAKFAAVRFQKFSKHRFKLLFKSPTGNVKLKLVMRSKEMDTSGAKIAASKALVAKSDVAIVVVGIEEGEFQDRSSLKLPGHQEQMLLELAQTGKPLVVLLSGGSAVNMENWIDRVPGILQIWYPGEQGGPAIAEILFGAHNPSGRLPFSYPRNEGHLPLTYNHKPTGRGDDYIAESGLPLFPFGYGLSYTQFDYSQLQLTPKQSTGQQPIAVDFVLKNTGTRAGTEIVQLYLRDELSSVSRPIQELKGFQSVYLEPGESRQVRMTLTPDMLELLDVHMKKVIEPGTFSIMVGSSSRDIRLRDKIEVISK